jgi:hypothetical protein
MPPQSEVIFKNAAFVEGNARYLNRRKLRIVQISSLFKKARRSPDEK